MSWVVIIIVFFIFIFIFKIGFQYYRLKNIKKVYYDQYYWVVFEETENLRGDDRNYLKERILKCDEVLKSNLKKVMGDNPVRFNIFRDLYEVYETQINWINSNMKDMGFVKMKNRKKFLKSLGI